MTPLTTDACQPGRAAPPGPILSGIPVALGTAGFGTQMSPEASFRVLDAYAALGGRVLDTANNYAYWNPLGKGGDSEAVIGNWLARVGRSNFTVMTKIGSLPVDPAGDRRNLEGLSPAAVRHAADASLERLRVDAVDILLAHHDDRATPLADTWRAFNDLVAAGKVRMAGISNYRPERVLDLARIAREQAWAPIGAVQFSYSLIAPLTGTDTGPLVVLDAAMKAVLARRLPEAVIFGYSPLLGGKVFEAADDARWPQAYDTPDNRSVARDIRRNAEALGVSPSAWVLKRIADEGIWPVTATRDPARLASNLALFRR